MLKDTFRISKPVARELGGHECGHHCAVKPAIRIPFGDYLWDPVATIALGVATGAAFGREVMTGVYESDMGLWTADCAGALPLAP